MNTATQKNSGVAIVAGDPLPRVQLLPLFATPVAMYDLPDMEEVNRELAACLVAESVSRSTVHRSNVGGWHSPNLAGRREPCFTTLFQRIATRVREVVDALAQENGQALPAMRVGMHAWSMVMRNGHYTIPHDHAEVHWATVHYVDAGDADEAAHPESGVLSLVDPRHGGRPMPGLDLVGGTFTVPPRTGRLVVFPGWMLHYVHAYLGQRPRISISCNVMFELTSPLP
jgi:uncharacterized protein (TIGR02466 family)